MEDSVVVVELPETGRGRVVLDSAASSGSGSDAVTVVVVAMEGETGSSNAAALMTECMSICIIMPLVTPRDRDSTSLWRLPNGREIVGRAHGGGIVAFS